MRRHPFPPSLHQLLLSRGENFLQQRRGAEAIDLKYLCNFLAYFSGFFFFFVGNKKRENFIPAGITEATHLGAVLFVISRHTMAFLEPSNSHTNTSGLISRTQENGVSSHSTVLRLMGEIVDSERRTCSCT